MVARALGVALQVVGGALVLAAVAMVVYRVRGYGDLDALTLLVLLVLGAPLLLAGRRLSPPPGG